MLRTNPAQRLYQRLGFEITSESDTHIYMELDPVPRLVRRIEAALKVTLVAAATILPWVLHFSLGWTAAVAGWLIFLAQSQRLSAQRENFYKRVSFILPFCSFISLCAYYIIVLVKGWL